MHTFIDAS